MVRIYHNPRCSKSRATLGLLRDNGIEPEIVHYLDQPPTADDVLALSGALGLAVRKFVRKGEEPWKRLDLARQELDDKALAAAIASDPILLERPIVVSGGKAVIGRPPENVLDLIKG